MIGRYDDIRTIDLHLLDTLLNQLTINPNAKALITISQEKQTGETMKQARRLLKYLVIDKKLVASRLDFLLHDASRERTEIWFVPEGAPYPAPPDKHIISGDELTKNSPK